jgi:hypothetical protein
MRLLRDVTRWAQCRRRSGTRRREKRDEIRYFPRSGGAPDRDAAERVHQRLPATLVVRVQFARQLVDQAHSGLCLDPARRDAYDANALRAHLLRKPLAVVRERGLRRRISQGSLISLY